MKEFKVLLILLFLVYNTSIGYSKRPHIQETEHRSYHFVNSTHTANKFRFNGEYGLWVQESNDQMTVHWITVEPDSGFLIVLNNDRQIDEYTTPLSQSHKVTFNKPRSKMVTIRYGSLRNTWDKHETVIYFEEKRPKAIFTNVDSIYVLGDLHGYFDNLVQLLTNAKMIDSDLNWTANKKHLIALGDLFDRGHNVTKTLWFLYKLERQAEKAGGRVHILLGNHEIMTFLDDVRYLSSKEKLIATTHNTRYSKLFDLHDSILGKWLGSKPGLIKIDKILFAHGGVTPEYKDYSVQAFNDSLHTYLYEDIFTQLLQDSVEIGEADTLLFARRLLFFFDENSVFWHRGYVQTDTLKNELKSVLKKFKSNFHVVAHTPVNTIHEKYDGKIIATDMNRPISEMLLLVRYKKNKYKRYKYQTDGGLISLKP